MPRILNLEFRAMHCILMKISEICQSSEKTEPGLKGYGGIDADLYKKRV